MRDRPDVADYAPYYRRYVDLVPAGDILEQLAAEHPQSLALLATVSAERETFRYAPGKWSLREVVGHLVDAERVFAYRALHFARGDAAPLPSLEQDEWAAISNAGERPLAELLAEWSAVRTVTLATFRGLDAAAWERRGVASGNSFTVAALAYIILGHELYHRHGLEQRYLS
ncbi:MAG: DinB family protein [Thermoanaerobaculia bacterium]